jgi:hypothetical protein
VPQPIEQLVQKQNLEFHHNKSHFNYSYYQFIKQLLTFNFNYIRQQVETGAGTPTVSGELASQPQCAHWKNFPRSLLYAMASTVVPQNNRTQGLDF